MNKKSELAIFNFKVYQSKKAFNSVSNFSYLKTDEHILRKLCIEYYTTYVLLYIIINKMHTIIY